MLRRRWMLGVYLLSRGGCRADNAELAEDEEEAEEDKADEEVPPALPPSDMTQVSDGAVGSTEAGVTRESRPTLDATPRCSEQKSSGAPLQWLTPKPGTTPRGTPAAEEEEEEEDEDELFPPAGVSEGKRVARTAHMTWAARGHPSMGQRAQMPPAMLQRSQINASRSEESWPNP